MRRLLLLLTMVICCICLAACDFGDDLFGKRGSYDEELKLTPTPTGPADHFGNKSVQYEKENARYKVSFSFFVTKAGKYVPQEATIHLAITNDEGEVVYRKDHEVTERDYGTPNSSSVGVLLLGSIYVKSDEITPGLSTNGTMAISAELPNGNRWDEERLWIYDLPLKQLQISMPATPLTVTEYDYHGNVERRAEVLSVDYEASEYGLVNIKTTVKLIENNDKYSATGYFKMNFKLKNTSDVIVQSGVLIVGPMAIGDTMLGNQMIAYDLDRNEEYTLELVDYR
ncbi:MAG: hypothetical protein K6E71_05510 [Lachnospiraceae bacterium]|nr:hypothetical protein [Lachnospiraceae bacterium]